MERGESSNQLARSHSRAADFFTVETRLPITQGNRRFSVKFYGVEITTVVTSFPDVIDTWVGETEQLLKPNTSRTRIVGLTIQEPDYVFRHPLLRISCSRPQMLTICVGNRCLMIQLHLARCMPDSLQRFLTHPKNRFVGYHNFFDREKLFDHSGHNLILLNCRHIGDYIFGIDHRGDFLNCKLEFLRNEYLKLRHEFERCRETGVFGGALWRQQVQYCTVQAYLYYNLGIDFCMADYP